MTTSDMFAIAAHLHVLLRRKTGRVTDTEWMATNPEYARAIVVFAREKAANDGLDELLPWADKLEAASHHMGGTERKPLLQSAAESLQRTRGAHPGAARRASGFADSVPASGFGHSRHGEGDGPDGRYVGGIR